MDMSTVPENKDVLRTFYLGGNSPPVNLRYNGRQESRIKLEKTPPFTPPS
jgi:hypothetical protein